MKKYTFLIENEDGESVQVNFTTPRDASWKGKPLRKFCDFLRAEGYVVCPTDLGWSYNYE